MMRGANFIERGVGKIGFGFMKHYEKTTENKRQTIIRCEDKKNV